MRIRVWLTGLLLVLTVWAAWSGSALAQEPPSPAAASDQADSEGSINWQEALFVLMVTLIVMMGLVGFEWVQRRKRSSM